MNALDLIRRLHQHRGWVNAKLIDAARTLSDEQLRRPFPIGQGSIWKSLLHLYAAEFVWLEALLGNENPLVPGDVPGKLPGNQEGQGRIESLDELAERWRALDGRWNDYLSRLTDDALVENVFKISTSSAEGSRHGTRRCDVLLHICTHAQYTTAQLVNMFRHVGVVRPPDVMLISLARQESCS